MASLPLKFLSLRECTLESLDITYPSAEPKQYFRSTTEKAFSQVFDLELVTTRFDITQAFELLAWLTDNTAGTHGTFTVANPFYANVLSNEVRQIVTRTSIPIFAKSVPVENLTPMISAALTPGTLFNFANHPKVYMVTNAPNANAQGQSTINFAPACYQPIPAGTELKCGRDCQFKVSAKAEVHSLTASVSSGLRESIIIPCRERG